MVVRDKGAGKKIVVSMGATAASGGYWISADADKIVADPATLTGSIGVFSGKFMVAKGLGDLGVTTDRTADGGFAGMASPFTPFTPEQLQRLNASLDQIYDGFVARVAAGRKLPPAAVAQSAKGRVWTGQQAKQLGLVDELGGLFDAVRVAHDVAGLPADQPGVVAVYPEPLSTFAALRELLSHGADMKGAAVEAVSALDGPAGDLARALTPLFQKSQGVMVRMPDLGVAR
jgi:protease-4